MGPIHSLDDVVDMLRRRAFPIVFVIVTGAIVSLWVALNQTPVFSSSEVIQIEPPEIAVELALATATGSWAKRLQMIEQRLMARDNLRDLIDEFGLYAEQPALRPSDKIDQLRQSIQIQSAVASGLISKVTITATLQSPTQAAAIAHEIAKQTIDHSDILRIASARETLDFFLLQESKLTARIDILEARIAGFRNSDDISITGIVDFRRYEIAAINSAIFEIDRQYNTLQSKVDQIDETIWQATADKMLGGFQQEMTNLNAQKSMLADRKQLLETIPQDQRELTKSVRQLEQLNNQLNETLPQLAKAEVSYRLESQHRLERLTVLEPAKIPVYPVAVPRVQMVITGIMISLMAAFGLALLLESRNRAIRTASQMQRELGYAPIVSIPPLDGSKTRS